MVIKISYHDLEEIIFHIHLLKDVPARNSMVHSQNNNNIHNIFISCGCIICRLLSIFELCIVFF
jgi:hypothetical protein